MLHLRGHLRFYFTRHLEMHQNVKKKMHFMLQVMTQLTVQSRGAPDDATLGGAPKDTLSHLHKNTQDGSFEVAQKGTLEVALELHLWLHLFILKCVQIINAQMCTKLFI